MKGEPEFLDQGEGAPVVLLHSSMSSKSQWRPLIAQLKGSFRVIAVDLYGYGGASFPPNAETFSLHDEVERIDSILRKLLGPTQLMHLAGHSFGGAVALRFAHEHPGRVGSLSLFEPVSFHLLSREDKVLISVLEMAGELPALLARGEKYRAAELFIDYWSGTGSFAASPEKVRRLFSRQVAKVALDFRALLEEPLTLDDLSSLSLPVCLIGGRGSRPPAQRVLEKLASSLPSSILHWIEGGHMSPITRAHRVNEIILAHLKGLSQCPFMR